MWPLQLERILLNFRRTDGTIHFFSVILWFFFFFKSLCLTFFGRPLYITWRLGICSISIPSSHNSTWFLTLFFFFFPFNKHLSNFYVLYLCSWKTCSHFGFFFHMYWLLQGQAEMTRKLIEGKSTISYTTGMLLLLLFINFSFWNGFQFKEKLWRWFREFSVFPNANVLDYYRVH